MVAVEVRGGASISASEARIDTLGPCALYHCVSVNDSLRCLDLVSKIGYTGRLRVFNCQRSLATSVDVVFIIYAL